MTTLFRQLDAYHSEASYFNRTSMLHMQKPGIADSRPQFPQEIFDLIVDHFHDQPEALRICALVSPQWLASARSHIFYRITLGPSKISQKSGFFSQRKKATSCQRLYDLIEAQIELESRLENITRYIREIHLQEGVLNREWIAQEHILPSLLRALNNVRRLEISRAAAMSIDWETLPSNLKSALLDHTLRLESFSELKLSNILFKSCKDTATILCACRDLRALEVDHVLIVDGSADTFNGEMDHKLDAAGRTSSLDTLVVGPRTSTAFITSFLLHSSAPLTLETVRNLRMSISGDWAKFAKLLQASTSVETLEVTLMNDVNLEAYWNLPQTNWLRLSQVPYLRDLKINIDILQRMEDPLPWLSALLGTGADSKQNVVRTISVLYSLYLPAPYMDRFTYNGMFSRWSDIDAVLCGEVASDSEKESGQGYKSLERVRLEFALENPIGFGVAPRFLNELVLNSPALRSKGILHIHAFDTSI